MCPATAAIVGAVMVCTAPATLRTGVETVTAAETTEAVNFAGDKTDGATVVAAAEITEAGKFADDETDGATAVAADVIAGALIVVVLATLSSALQTMRRFLPRTYDTPRNDVSVSISPCVNSRL